MATIRELTDYYVARMVSIYRDKPKAADTVSLFTKQFLADNLIATLQLGFDIDEAVGKQLDILGKYIGAPRDVGVEDTRPFFGFVDYDYPAGNQNENGFVIYGSLAINSQGIWYEYVNSGQATTQLSDYQYRQLMKLKISTNNTENTMAAIQQQIEDFFPGQLQVRDNLNMTLTYFFGTSFQLPLSVLESYLPRPMGVGVEAVEAIGFDVTVDGEPAFSSETPEPAINLGITQYSTSATLVLTNAKTSSFSVVAIVSTNSVFVIDNVSPLLPTTLLQNESVSFDILAASSIPVTDLEAFVQIFITSSAGLSRFDIAVRVTIEGVELDWIAFDNFSGYDDGSISSLFDSWGWRTDGTFVGTPVITPRDNFESYPDGSIAELDGGYDWLENGEFTIY